MKSPTISAIKGFLISEIMIAFAIMTLLLTSAVILSASMSELHETAVKKLDRLSWVSQNNASSTLFSKKLYGNDTVEMSLEPITIVNSDYKNAWGRDTCNPRLEFNQNTIHQIKIDAGNTATDLEVRNKIAYVTADSSTVGLPDFYIIDVSHDSVIASHNTGPGLASLEVAGHYVYAANAGTTNQLQVIDISNRSLPIVIAKYKLPLPNASATPPFATAIFYSKGLIYLGTEKWEGEEFSVIDVHVPSDPHFLGGFKTDTLINSIYVRNGLAYVAASDIGQMRILDVKNPAAITEIYRFSPSGYETQQGRSLSFFEDVLSLGRTTGGFNTMRNHEIYSFSTTTEQIVSHDIPGGVYGIVQQPQSIFLITHSPGHEFQIWDAGLSQLKFERSLGFNPVAMSCDGNGIYIL